MIFSISNLCSFFRWSMVVTCLLALRWTNESRFAAAQETAQASGKEEEIGRREYLQYALINAGDVERGKSLFNNKERAQCDKCHMINGMEKSGPNLDGIADKYSWEQLLRQVLYPSETITRGFEQVKIRTHNGKVLAGRMERSNQIQVKLVDAEGKVNSVNRSDIEEISESTVSFMPSDLQKSLTIVEFADLMTYVRTLKLSKHDGFTDGGKKVAIGNVLRPVTLRPIHAAELDFENPVWCGALPGTDSDMLVIEHMKRRIWRLIRADDQVRKELFLELGAEVHTGSDQGVMSMAFHPDFVHNRRYFLEHEVKEEGIVKTTIVERAAANDGLKDSGQASRRLIETFQPAGNHNGGCIAFGPDGMLYAGFGDGGPQKDPNGYSQNPRILLGSMIRIDVDHRDEGLEYAIPKDNPYWEAHRTDPSVRAETWAIGFREPWRFSFDSVNGDFYVGDVGQDKFEEVCIVRRGENHGWNVVEAFEPFSDEYYRPNEKLTGPVFAYPHGLGFSITGGFVYHGKRSPSFDGVYVFGDYNTRLIWGLKQKDGKLESVFNLGTAPNGISSFGLDQQGEIYLVTYKGTIYHVDLSETEYPHAKTPDPTSPQLSGPWRDLFNGEDLTGWSLVGDKGKAWVENNEIVCHMVKGTKEHTFVRTDEEFSDFILEADCLLEGDFHTAILFRCVETPPDALLRLNGYQLKIDPTSRRWTGGIFDDFGPNWYWLHNLADPSDASTSELTKIRTAARESFKMNEWNRIRIQAIGGIITTWVNDVPCVHLVHEKYKTGCIAIKIHSWNGPIEREKVLVRYKNLRIIDSEVSKHAMPSPLPPIVVPVNPTPKPGETPRGGE